MDGCEVETGWAVETIIMKELQPEIDLVLVDFSYLAIRQQKAHLLTMFCFRCQLLLQWHQNVHVGLLPVICLINKQLLQLRLVSHRGTQLFANLIVCCKLVTQPSGHQNGQGFVQ